MLYNLDVNVASIKNVEITRISDDDYSIKINCEMQLSYIKELMVEIKNICGEEQFKHCIDLTLKN